MTLVAGTAIAAPLVARAQQRDGMRRLGVIMGSLANDPEGQAYAAAFVKGLGEHNWKDGGNLRIEWRWAGGHGTHPGPDDWRARGHAVRNCHVLDHRQRPDR